MINLRKIINIFIYFYIFFGIIFLSNKNLFSSENKIIFKINNKAFTTLDYVQRLEYLDFVGNNNDLDKDTIINDYISANLFFEYYNNLNIKNDYEIKINEIYENILNINENNNKIYKYKINKENIIFNIQIDFIRKTILENIINNNFEEFNSKRDEIDLLYKFNITYLNINLSSNINIIKTIKNFKNIKIEKVIQLLEDNNIAYFSKVREIDNIYKIDKRIRDNILRNNDFFIIEFNDALSLIFIQKEFETYDDLFANIFSIKTQNDINKEYLLCSNLSNLKNESNIINKEYKFSDLNNELKENLTSINDFIKYQSEDENIYIVLCDIKYNREKLNNINLNKLLNNNVSEIEKQFINKYSKIYNLIQINE
tara:strand:+ start:2016 stop:3125 length:1110 start_codon:yes stop_codon:yes gene_type:complete